MWVKEYEKKYPLKIHAIYQEQNVGAMRNAFEFTLPQCKGKYIAMLEGDDYWTDPYKLQKQVDFLEANTDSVICAHAVTEIDKNEQVTRILEPDILKSKYTYWDINLSITLWTNSVVFRNCVTTIPDWVYSLPAGDFPLWLMLTKYGNIGYLNETLSIYRNNEAGIHSSLSRTKKIQNGLILINKVSKHFGIEHRSYFKILDEKYFNYLTDHIKELYFKKSFSEARAALIIILKSKFIFKSFRTLKLKWIINIIIGPSFYGMLRYLNLKHVFTKVK